MSSTQDQRVAIEQVEDEIRNPNMTTGEPFVLQSRTGAAIAMAVAIRQQPKGSSLSWRRQWLRFRHSIVVGIPWSCVSQRHGRLATAIY
ncbi:hypothetical protein LMH87_004292 [Akanthomyces muscarius]|uniref:Uncharacterized protein n=1 Tax=Akanthomyces muscarius TaxID=2231603 RepID=A0A9W8Q5C3_AKAMU|nr:hypothetical protein LMH87_004292 [Akanthomyces muscarius]KAJ4145442.1 hypothetical protein LMH87_004292 [Akanthomyces muscarius]